VSLSEAMTRDETTFELKLLACVMVATLVLSFLFSYLLPSP